MSKIEVNQISSQCGSTLTIGQSGDTVTLAAGATQSGFGRTGTVDWDTTAKTTNFTAVSGNGYFVNTTSGAITVTLPATPSAGDIVSLADYTNTWGTNAVTVGRNSQPIGGVAADATLSTEGQSVTFIYVDGTEGWKNIQDSTSNVTGNPYIQATGGTISYCGNYKIHTFTGPGTFTVCSAATSAPNNIVDYLVVAGGGGGGAGCGGGGGGGAGGLRVSASTYIIGCNPASPIVSPTGLPISATTYPITVGAGGNQGGGTPAGLPALPGNGGSGSNSIFSTITSTGGGGGAGANTGPLSDAGDGGSGGGGTRNRTPAGLGNTPPVAPPQGNNGGAGTNGTSGDGGGGAIGTGSNNSSWPGQPACYAYGGNGGVGAGFANNTFGSNGQVSSCIQYFSGGGGGGNYGAGTTTPAASGYGGLGGGGCGALASTNPSLPSQAGSAGTTNTGGGGGGGGEGPTAGTPGVDGAGGAGGSGIVIIRYKYQ